MNTVEALEYLRNNPKAVVSTIGREERRIEMSIDKELFDWNKSTFVTFTLYHDDGRAERIDFSEWIQLHTEWEVTKEVRYYVKFKVPENLKLLLSDDNYLNYSFGKYFFGTNDEYSDYKTKFTRDEIEEFGIAHPEVRREDLEFIEVVE